MSLSSRRGLVAALLACCLIAPAAEALVRDEKSALADKLVRHPSLHIPTLLQPAAAVPDELGARLQRDLATLGIAADASFYDARAGRLTSFLLSQPLVPGTGVGNSISGLRPTDDEAGRDAVWSSLRAFLQERQGVLRVDVAELGTPSIGILEEGNLIQVYAPRVISGIPVRDGGLSAVINHGNLIVLGLDHWADASGAAGLATVGETLARMKMVAHVEPAQIESIEGSQLEYVPMAKGDGYEFRLAWAVRATVVGDHGSWEALVDAATGDLLAFEDRNQYASRRMTGGVYPVSNDQRPPDGVEQIGWPMPFANVTIGASTVFTNSSGSLGCTNPGTGTTTLAGNFVRISDNCGAISETAGNDFDLGFGPTALATDCQVPAGHSAGDTKSSRTGFYELNRIIQQAKGYLPGNAWLGQQLTSNMNINLQCNAFWNGSTVNFYRDSATCRNTGEQAAIFDHEWGHGMDDNGINGNIAQPGEAIADIHAVLRLNDSCVGRGFFKNTVCSGYGDPCTGTPATGCTGVRDANFANHVSGLPHGMTWLLANCAAAGQRGPCNRETHCEGQIVAEVGWDMQFRDMRAAPFNFDSNTALELTTRLFYLGSQNVSQWYTCGAGCETTGTCGCSGTGGYLLVLGADDDNGNLNDGTPHMEAIRNAFNRHQLACNTPVVLNAGCAGGPTTAPVVTAVAGPDSVDLSWGAVAGASRYFVYRTEGVSACDFGKIKVGDVTTTTFTDTGLLSGRQYSYVVLPVSGATNACFGRASACSSATPTAVTCPPVADFALSCSPAALTATQQGSAPSTCTVQSLNAFSAAVNLSCVGLPAGASCAYAPATVTPPSNGSTTTALTVSAGTAAPGNYTFQARGVSGALSQTFNMTLAVNTFTLNCAPTSMTIAQGGSGTSTCTVQSQNAFASAVNLSCASLPAGITCSYSPASVTPPANGSAPSTLTVNVGGAVASGTYVFQAQGVTGGLTRTVNISVTVPAQPDFGVNCSPASVSANQGGSGTSTCTVNSMNAFTSAVNLSCTGLPAGASCAFNPGTVTPPSNGTAASTLTVSVTNTPVGSYNFQAQAVSGALTRVFDMTLVVNTLSVEPFALAVDASGNGVFQPNETVVMAPSWRNTGSAAINLTGVTSGFTGPAGPVYTNPDSAANYGTVGVSAQASCSTNGNCYTIAATTATRPTSHWDATIVETVTPTSMAKTWTLHVGDTFTDVPPSSGFYRFIETIVHKNVTGGCSASSYCPGNSTTRDQMAVFVLVSREAPGYVPVACVAGSEMFNDVSSSSPFCRWIEELARRGVVNGCARRRVLPGCSRHPRADGRLRPAHARPDAHPAGLHDADVLRRAGGQPVLPLDRGAGPSRRRHGLRRRQLLSRRRREPRADERFPGRHLRAPLVRHLAIPGRSSGFTGAPFGEPLFRRGIFFTR